MKGNFLVLAGAALLLLLALVHQGDFLGDFRTGILLGAGLVVFVLYPAYLRNFERRLCALEGRQAAGGRAA